MIDKLSADDAAALYLEEPNVPMQIGSVSVFDNAAGGITYDKLVALVTQRIAQAPRYRQRPKFVPGNISAPIWVDDTYFDVTFHVRRSALPKPGTCEQLRELVARIMARPLDRTKPLWEMYLVEGVEDNKFALLMKSHLALVDGVSSMDIGHIILDKQPDYEMVEAEQWEPHREPTTAELLLRVAGEQVKSPAQIASNVRKGVDDVTSAVTTAGRSAISLVTAAMSVARTPAHGPLNFDVSAQRRYAMCELPLEDFKAVRRSHGGTVNDVILTVIAGALRSWMSGRGTRISPRKEFTALVPVSVEQSEATGRDIQPFLVHLPIGESDPLVRLSRISYEMSRHRESTRLMGADTLSTIAGFAPPTLHALGARLGADISQRTYNLVVTNVPGPQTPLYLAGNLMVGAYPVVALTRGHGLSIGLTSYHGGVFFGLTADRDGVPDVEDIATSLQESLDELVSAVKRSEKTRTQKKRGKRST